MGAVQGVTLGSIREGTDSYQLTKNQGTFTMQGLKIEAKHSFLEYVFGGCEMDLSIAIDFTLSNGDPKQPNSLHFFDPQRNQYLQAI